MRMVNRIYSLPLGDSRPGYSFNAQISGEPASGWSDVGRELVVSPRGGSGGVGRRTRGEFDKLALRRVGDSMRMRNGKWLLALSVAGLIGAVALVALLSLKWQRQLPAPTLPPSGTEIEKTPEEPEQRAEIQKALDNLKEQEARFKYVGLLEPGSKKYIMFWRETCSTLRMGIPLDGLNKAEIERVQVFFANRDDAANSCP